MLTLRMTSSDYYDADEDVFVMTVGASVTSLQTNVKIKDQDNVSWECYLYSLEFVPSDRRGKRNVYIARYKVYE